jgi:large subunit ribosomal protein L15
MSALRLHLLASPPGARRRSKRKGRGIGSGRGKTAGRGTKGQKARTTIRPGFEGGQTPLQRRMRKRRGISKTAYPQGRFRKEYAVVNLGQLERLEPQAEVTPQLLLERRIVRKLGAGLRILGGGKLTRPLRVKANHFSASARQKLEALGGSAEVI